MPSRKQSSSNSSKPLPIDRGLIILGMIMTVYYWSNMLHVIALWIFLFILALVLPASLSIGKTKAIAEAKEEAEAKKLKEEAKAKEAIEARAKEVAKSIEEAKEEEREAELRWLRDPLGDFLKPSYMVVVEISEEDLLRKNTKGLKEKGAVLFNDWKGLGELIGKEESRKRYKELLDLQPIYNIVFLYMNGRYVTCIMTDVVF